MPQLELPFMISKALTRKLSIEAGPTISIRLNSNQAFTGDTYDIDYWKIVNYGVNGGLRYKILTKLSLSCRYYQTVKNIASHHEILDWNTYDIRRLSVKEFDNNIQLYAYW